MTIKSLWMGCFVLSVLLYQLLNAETVLTYQNRMNPGLIRTLKQSTLQTPSAFLHLQLSYADAKQTADMLKQLIPTLSVVPDLRTQSLEIMCTQAQARQVEKAVADWDVPVQTLQFDVQIIEMALQDSETLKSAFSNLGSGFKINFNFQTNQVTGPDALESLLQAYVQSGKAKVLAKPMIATLAHSKASLKLGDSIPYSTATYHQNFVAYDIHYIDTGIEFSILPKTTSSNRLCADISAQVKGVKVWKELAGSTQPVLSLRKADTTVYLNFNQTLVIAGLLDEQQKENLHKTAFLSDLPFIGHWFIGKSIEKTTTDVWLMITPKKLISPQI